MINYERIGRNKMEMIYVDPERAVICAGIALIVGVVCYRFRHRKEEE